jgi:hypothetical protein
VLVVLQHLQEQVVKVVQRDQMVLQVNLVLQHLQVLQDPMALAVFLVSLVLRDQTALQDLAV